MDVHQVSARRRVTLANVLTEVPAVAALLLRHVKWCRDSRQCVKSARLACQALRKGLDDNVTDLTVRVVAADVQRWNVGQIPSLSRWPSCSSLILTLRVVATDSSRDLSSLASLPFSGLQLAARQRIRDVTLELECLTANVPQPGRNVGSVVLAITSHLPNLRRFVLEPGGVWSYSSLQQQLMYDSLATLPHLEALVLPCCRALNRVGALAGTNLRRLEVGYINMDGAVILSPQAAEGISRLHRLEKLEISNLRMNELDGGAAAAGGAGRGVSLSGLLDSLPASLQELSLPCLYVQPAQPDESMDVYTTLSACHLRSVRVEWDGPDWVQVDTYSLLAEQLLASRTMTAAPQRQLEELKVPELVVPEGQSLGSLELRPLRELLQRTKHVDVWRLRLQELDSVLPALELFGKPQWLNVPIVGEWVMLRLRMNSAEASCLAAGTTPPHTVAQRQPQAATEAASASGPASAVPSVDEIAARVMPRVVGANAAAAVRGGLARRTDTTNSATSAAAASGSSTGAIGEPNVAEDAGDLPPTGLVLLCGELMAFLAQAPKALVPWLQWLEARAQAAAGDDLRYVVSWLVLPPPFTAVLLECSPAEVMAAVRSAAEGRAAGGLEVVPVVLESHRDLAEIELPYATYVDALEEVLQDIWDERHVSGAAAALGEKDLLRQLVERVRALGLGVKSGELPAA